MPSPDNRWPGRFTGPSRNCLPWLDRVARQGRQPRPGGVDATRRALTSGESSQRIQGVMARHASASDAFLRPIRPRTTPPQETSLSARSLSWWSRAGRNHLSWILRRAWVAPCAAGAPCAHVANGRNWPHIGRCGLRATCDGFSRRPECRCRDQRASPPDAAPTAFANDAWWRDVLTARSAWASIGRPYLPERKVGTETYRPRTRVGGRWCRVGAGWRMR